MLWLVDSAHLPARVNHLFASPKQAPKNPGNIFPIVKPKAMSKPKFSANTTDVQRKNGNFFNGVEPGMIDRFRNF